MGDGDNGCDSELLIVASNEYSSVYSPDRTAFTDVALSRECN